MMIIGYHGDAQTPNVRLHTVPLLVELRVYSFRLERRQRAKKWKDNCHAMCSSIKTQMETAPDAK